MAVNDHTDKERIAVLEIEVAQLKTVLIDINSKLDSLLDLKSKGMGAFWLIGLIIGVGGITLVTTLTNLFRPHL